MNNKFLNRHPINFARQMVLMAVFNLMLLLLAVTASAQIYIQDGTPLAALASSGAGPTVNKAFTVTAGVSVLVVILEDRQNAAVIAEPATITWNGTNILTQDTNSFANTSNFRSMAMYHLYNPPVGTGNITATYATGNNTIVVTAYTLGGVDTTTPPLIIQTNNAGTVTSLFGTATGVTAGSWAALGSIWGNTTALTYGGSSGTATVVSSTGLGGSSIIAGYVANLSAGAVTIGATNSVGTKGCFIAEIFAPAGGPPSLPIITTQPASRQVFTNLTVKLAVNVLGTPPLTYQWFTNSSTSPLSNGGNITGATSNVLTLANVTLANAGDYTVVVANAQGSVTSSVANLTVLLPSGAYESNVVSDLPFAFYTFSETGDPSTGTLVANDSVSTFNGTYGAASQNGFNGVLGPQASADGLVGFPNGNTALGLNGAPSSAVALPAFNLNNGAGANVLTLTAWIHPNGLQANAAGIVFCRGGSTISGITYLDNNPSNYLGYNWANDANNYNWNSGLIPPTNVWSLVALVVTPTNATLYVCNTNNGILASTHVYNHVVQKFDGPTEVGYESYASSRVFNGSIDEVALFGQALTQSQVVALFSAASGIQGFSPTIAVSPTWAPTPIYIGQASSITVSASGTAPLSYQWMAGTIGSGNYANLTDGGNMSGSTSATLTITNAQLSNSRDYVVRVSNAYGVITNVTPATLTVLAPGPATNFTLNYGGNPIAQGIGADWNSVNSWNPGGLPATTSALYGNPGSSYEVVVGALIRNPAGTTYNAFPGATTSLVIDGNGGVDFNGSPVATGEFRFKNSTPAIPSTNYFNNLVLNGGELQIGDSTHVVLQGKLTVQTNSVFGTQGGVGTNQAYQVDSYLTGSGTIVLYLSNTNALLVPPLPTASLDITGTTNTFTGQWDIEQGPLVGNGLNSLGSNTITINTNGIFESNYPINNTNANSWLVLNGQFYLTQNDTFRVLFLNGTPLAPGTYPAATLSSTYPANFPATFPVLYGTTATSASGQITVLAATVPVGITQQPVSIRAVTNTVATFTVVATGYPINYQWYQVSGGVTNLISGATNAAYSTTPVQESDTGTGYFVVVSNQNNTVTSTKAILTAGHLVVTSGSLRNDQYNAAILGNSVGASTLGNQLYPGSPWLSANAPSKTEYLSVLEGSQDLPVNSGQRIYGWFTPATSGDYVFFTATDDGGALWLSTDSSVANSYLIAQVEGAMIKRDWSCQNTNCLEYVNYFTTSEWRSDQFELSGGNGGNNYAQFNNGWNAYPGFNSGDGGIPLVAGTKYYIELDNYQAGGDQCAAVTYKLAGNADPSSNSPSLLLGNNISTLLPDTAPVSSQPVIGNISVSGSNVIISGSNGVANVTYNVLASTNLLTPLASWTITATQTFDSNGNFRSTNAVTAGASQTFYRLQLNH